MIMDSGMLTRTLSTFGLCEDREEDQPEDRQPNSIQLTECGDWLYLMVHRL